MSKSSKPKSFKKRATSKGRTSPSTRPTRMIPVRLDQVPMRPKRAASQGNLATTLQNLEQSELVRRLSEPELEYVFKHVLTQLSAYESLLVKARRSIHRRVAETYETLHAERLDEYAPLLAQHYAEAGDDAKTLEYSARAGDAAARIYANDEALMHYARAIEIAKRGPHEAETLRKLYVRQGRVYQLSGNYTGALAIYNEMEQLARVRGDRALELAALLERMTVHSAPTAKFDPEKSKALSAQALALARELNDRPAEAKVLWNLLLVSFFLRQPEEGVRYGEQSLALARELNLREQLAFTLNDLHNTYVLLGNFDRAKEVSAQAREIWRELDNLPMLGDNLISAAIGHFAAGEFTEALASAEEGNRISESIGNLWGQSYSRQQRGMVYLIRGEIDKAIQAMEESIHFGDQAGFLIPAVMVRAYLAFIYSQFGDTERALPLAHLSLSLGKSLPFSGAITAAVLALVHIARGELTVADKMLQEYAPVAAGTRSDPFFSVFLKLAVGELALARGEFQRAFDTGESLDKDFTALKSRPFRADALHLQARAKHGLGELDRAMELLAQARAEAESLGEQRILWQILALMAEIQAERGNLSAASELRQDARDSLSHLMEHLPPDLKESFLKLESVKRVIGETVSGYDSV